MKTPTAEELRNDCPWPSSVWTMTDADYVKSIPDEALRTRISGFLMRKGWKLACDAMEREP